MTLQDVLIDYLDYLRDDLTRMECWDAEHYTDEDRQALRDKIQEASDLEESL
jgi:hypothetical protein